jgi:hypothetical protein
MTEAKRRSHWAPFRESLRPWVVLVRNAVPVVGVYALGWSTSVTATQLWIDGASALTALVCFMTIGFSRNDSTYKPTDWFIVPVLLLIIGSPYWFMIVFLGPVVFDGRYLPTDATRDAVIVTGAGTVAMNLIETWMRGYHRQPDAKNRRDFNWEYSIHLARCAAILMVGFFFRARVLIVALSIVLAYIEIYPMRALRFLGGDATLDAENADRSKD